MGFSLTFWELSTVLVAKRGNVYLCIHEQLIKSQTKIKSWSLTFLVLTITNFPEFSTTRIFLNFPNCFPRAVLSNELCFLYSLPIDPYWMEAGKPETLFEALYLHVFMFSWVYCKLSLFTILFRTRHFAQGINNFSSFSYFFMYIFILLYIFYSIRQFLEFIRILSYGYFLILLVYHDIELFFIEPSIEVYV